MNIHGKTFVVAIFLLLHTACYASNSQLIPDAVKECSRCHTLTGNSTNPRYPKLAGQHADYLRKQLSAFQQGQTGPRPQPIMSAIASKLSNEDINTLAAYFARQKPEAGFAQNWQLDLGRKIYQGGLLDKGIPACSACHHPAGAGNAPANFPRLSGQHAAYIMKQLQNFKQQTRHNDARKIMQDIAAKMSPEEMKAVANYISGLH